MVNRREVPKINGSTAAFVALIVVLVLIIIIACSATIYILRADAEDGEALESQSRGRYHRSESNENHTYPKPSKNWLASIFRRTYHNGLSIREDKRRNIGGSRQGWFQAGSGDESPRNQKYVPNTASMQMTDQHSSGFGASRSSSAGTFPQPTLNHSFPSDATSSRFDLHGIHGHSYGNQSLLSATGIISSFQSQLYSPPPSPSTLAHERTLSSSPEPMEPLTNNSLNNFQGSSFAASESRHTIRTFEGGTKFIEEL